MNEETKLLYEFNERRNKLYYCPDLSDGLRRIDAREGGRVSEKELYIKGTMYDSKNAEIWFQIMKCDNNSLTRHKDDPPCEDETAINNYIEQLEIEIVVVNKQLDKLKKNGMEPTFTT